MAKGSTEGLPPPTSNLADTVMAKLQFLIVVECWVAEKVQ